MNPLLVTTNANGRKYQDALRISEYILNRMVKYYISHCSRRIFLYATHPW